MLRESGIQRLVNMSSASVYGIQDKSKPATELSPVNPQTLYAALKAETESAATALHSKDLPVFNFRAATLSGWTARGRLDLTCNIFCYQALFEHRVRIFGGAQYRPNLSVIDMAKCIVESLTHPWTLGGTYNVSEGNYRVEDIARTVVDHAEPGRRVDFDRVPSDDTRSYLLDESIRTTLIALSQMSKEEAESTVYRNVEQLREGRST
jgi:nucleoside-diphosphate-sugar epimerase